MITTASAGSRHSFRGGMAWSQKRRISLHMLPFRLSRKGSYGNRRFTAPAFLQAKKARRISPSIGPQSAAWPPNREPHRASVSRHQRTERGGDPYGMGSV